MHNQGSRILLVVNCRIGSLENLTATSLFSIQVNCRIGSLEILQRLLG